jgi:hypothetical protein
MKPQPVPNDDRTRESLGTLLNQLASESAALVRDELALAKREIAEDMHSFKNATIMLAIGSGLGFAALLFLLAAAAVALAPIVGPWQGVLIVGGAVALVAIIFAATGLTKLKRVNFTPEQTVQTLEEDKRWLKQLT